MTKNESPGRSPSLLRSLQLPQAALTIACLLSFGLSVGCSSTDDSTDGGSSGTGAASGTGGGSNSGAYPTDLSATGIDAWLMTGAYKQAPWTAESAAPRESSTTTSPHGRVQVYLNDTLVASQAAGNGGLDPNDFSTNPPHPGGVGAVKELYDDGDQMVGVAVMLKAADSGSGTGWTYYCWGPNTRCFSGEDATTAADPVYGTDITNCGACHGSDSVFTVLP